ncbi:hypothetical protein CORC01_08300 [Colletotrichum orchidophilum]|uniref:Uncharacterized protein n=1 Tax=Colletotrichum orchidophilum TaxID=1209926 RepID=A0A1G4B4Q2_9PEZI|nr:uncharacterized protein CORC01_08300 [Colletotrichum orchidophilum]OHE96377.1 hypothetical protein CORC01_08300 [Colletotrichum orchidophilum]
MNHPVIILVSSVQGNAYRGTRNTAAADTYSLVAFALDSGAAARRTPHASPAHSISLQISLTHFRCMLCPYYITETDREETDDQNETKSDNNCSDKHHCVISVAVSVTCTPLFCSLWAYGPYGIVQLPRRGFHWQMLLGGVIGWVDRGCSRHLYCAEIPDADEARKLAGWLAGGSPGLPITLATAAISALAVVVVLAWTDPVLLCPALEQQGGFVVGLQKDLS